MSDIVERPEHFDSILWSTLTDAQRRQIVAIGDRRAEEAARRPELAAMSEDDQALTYAVHNECWCALKDSIAELGPFTFSAEYAHQLEEYVRERLVAALRSAHEATK